MSCVFISCKFICHFICSVACQVPYMELSMIISFKQKASITWPSKAKNDAYFSFCWHF